MASHKSALDSYYEISTAVQMKWLSYYVNASSAHAATNARLMADIDLSSVCSTTAGNWTPIGNSYTISCSGTFDGNGKAISNLYIANATTDDQALFGYTVNCVIKNLSISGNITSTAAEVGLLAGHNYGQIIHCISSGSASGNSDVGGIAGFNGDGASITQCVNKAELSNRSYLIGGITATCFYASVTDCANEGTLKASNNNNTAGIVGHTYQTSTIKNCLNIGQVYVADVLTEDYPILGKDEDGASTLTNNYYLNTLNGTATYGIAKTADELKTGTVARLLNGGDGTTEKPLSAWGQNLATTGGDAYPVMMTNENANAVYNAKVYNGSSTVTAEGYMNLSYAAPTDNAMTVLKDAGIDKSLLPANVITAENTARRIVVTDGKDFYLPADVTADSASDARGAFRDGFHETICIPFAPSALPSNYNHPAYTSKDDATAYFSTVTALNAGESYMMKYTATAADTKANVTFENNGGNVTVLAAPATSAGFIGSFANMSSAPANSYILGVYDVSGTNTEKFRRATATYSPKAYRAYLLVPANGAKEMQIVFDNETTGIGAATPNSSLLTPNSSGDYFNLQGMKVNAPQQNGIYIHNGKKVVFRRK